MLSAAMKAIGVALVLVLAVVVYNWPKDKKMSSEGVAGKVAEVSVAVANKAAQVGSGVAQELKNAVEDSEVRGVDTQTQQIATVVKHSVAEKTEHRGGEVLANKTVLPEVLPAKEAVLIGSPNEVASANEVIAEKESRLVAERVRNVPQRSAPSSEQYQSAQKRLSAKIMELEEVMNGVGR